jgi:hypothetical protein
LQLQVRSPGCNSFLLHRCHSSYLGKLNLTSTQGNQVYVTVLNINTVTINHQEVDLNTTSSVRVHRGKYTIHLQPSKSDTSSAGPTFETDKDDEFVRIPAAEWIEMKTRSKMLRDVQRSNLEAGLKQSKEPKSRQGTSVAGCLSMLMMLITVAMLVVLLNHAPAWCLSHDKCIESVRVTGERVRQIGSYIEQRANGFVSGGGSAPAWKAMTDLAARVQGFAVHHLPKPVQNMLGEQVNRTQEWFS